IREWNRALERLEDMDKARARLIHPVIVDDTAEGAVTFSGFSGVHYTRAIGGEAPEGFIKNLTHPVREPRLPAPPPRRAPRPNLPIRSILGLGLRPSPKAIRSSLSAVVTRSSNYSVWCDAIRSRCFTAFRAWAKLHCFKPDCSRRCETKTVCLSRSGSISS